MVGSVLVVGGVVVFALAGGIPRKPQAVAFPEITPQPMCGHGPSPHDAPSVSNTSVANVSNMAYSVWCGAGLSEGFSSGVTISIEPNGFPDPAQTFRNMADFYGASVGTIQGVPALEEDPLHSAKPLEGAAVFFVINDLYITVMSNGSVALSDVVKVAEAIPPAMPVAGHERFILPS
jgi:hypothetical protein